MDEDNVIIEGELYVTGVRGYSNYEIAVKNGFVGTEEEWLEYMAQEEADVVWTYIQAMLEAGTLNFELENIYDGDMQSLILDIVPESGVLPSTIDLTEYVKKTQYATSSTGGSIKISNNYLTSVWNGLLIGMARTYAQYQSDANDGFISKGTLENVITGKDLTTKTYVDGLVGDINDALDAINNEVI